MEPARIALGALNERLSAPPFMVAPSANETGKTIAARLMNSLPGISRYSQSSLEAPGQVMDHVSVKADSGDAQEVPLGLIMRLLPGGSPQGNPVRLGVDQSPRRRHGITGQAQVAGGDVGRTAGQDAQWARASCQSIDDLIDGAVTAANEDRSRSGARRRLRQISSAARAGGSQHIERQSRLPQDAGGSAYFPFAPGRAAPGDRIVNERRAVQQEEAPSASFCSRRIEAEVVRSTGRDVPDTQSRSRVFWRHYHEAMANQGALETTYLVRPASKTPLTTLNAVISPVFLSVRILTQTLSPALRSAALEACPS